MYVCMYVYIYMYIKIMKQIKDVISAPLAKLMNRSSHNSVFPNILKIAKVIPIFKGK